MANTFNGLDDACARFTEKLAHSGISSSTGVRIVAGRHVYSIKATEEHKPIVYDKGQTLLVVRRGR